MVDACHFGHNFSIGLWLRRGLTIAQRSRWHTRNTHRHRPRVQHAHHRTADVSEGSEDCRILLCWRWVRANQVNHRLPSRHNTGYHVYVKPSHSSRLFVNSPSRFIDGLSKHQAWLSAGPQDSSALQPDRQAVQPVPGRVLPAH